MVKVKILIKFYKFSDDYFYKYFQQCADSSCSCVAG